MSASAAQRAALHAAFGSDSESDERDVPRAPPTLERYAVVPGLCLLRGWLSSAEQAALLDAVRAQGWAPPPDTAAATRTTPNQAMHFGHDTLPPFARRLVDDVAAAAAAHAMLPPQLACRAPAFNQLICNAYAPGQGITPHVDLAAFADGIAGVSLGAAAVMDFQRVADGVTARVLLRPGDLLTMHGAARYEWTQGIAARLEDEWEGAQLRRGYRVSLTLRRMAADVHVLSHLA